MKDILERELDGEAFSLTTQLKKLDYRDAKTVELIEKLSDRKTNESTTLRYCPKSSLVSKRLQQQTVS